LSGTFHVFRFALTSASSERAPCSTSLSAPIAATGLLIEPAWKSVAVVTAAPPRLVTPYARASIRPSWMIASERPLICRWDICAWMKASRSSGGTATARDRAARAASVTIRALDFMTADSTPAIYCLTVFSS
jgi:hypothetical protein